MKHHITEYHKTGYDHIVSIDTQRQNIKDIQEGDIIVYEDKEYMILKYEWFMKSFGKRGDMCMVKLDVEIDKPNL